MPTSERPADHHESADDELTEGVVFLGVRLTEKNWAAWWLIFSLLAVLVCTGLGLLAYLLLSA